MKTGQVPPSERRCGFFLIDLFECPFRSLGYAKSDTHTPNKMFFPEEEVEGEGDVESLIQEREVTLYSSDHDPKDDGYDLVEYEQIRNEARDLIDAIAERALQKIEQYAEKCLFAPYLIILIFYFAAWKSTTLNDSYKIYIVIDLFDIACPSQGAQ
ncbi:hypothetical protein Ciccas_001739 [Cichlidogyrus casuarinus]|uniref:Uncharacterized protein n=1 Tax=Cichlidogyrus casuarinus TaxID=1844966 RepID=A0ABD2QJI3_9PLAT